MIARGKYVILDASLGEVGIKKNWAIYMKDDTILETGPWNEIQKKYPGEEVLGSGEELLMPGLIDSHTHGAGLSFAQRGVSYDFLENSLLDFESSMSLEPETNSMLNAVKHIMNGCTTIHHNNWSMPSDEREFELCGRKIEAFEKTGIRLGFSLGIRNKSILAYDDRAFLQTLPEGLQEKVRYLVDVDTEKAVDDFLDVYQKLYEKYNGNKVRILPGPNWVHGSTDDFLIRVKECADHYGKVPIHIHCLQTPVQKCYGMRTYGKSLVEHLDDLGLVDDNLVLGHAVYVTQEDIELLGARRAMITHHPSCNLITRNGIAPVYHMFKAGVQVALGIDEKGINDDEDAFMEMRMIYFLHRQTGLNLCASDTLDACDVLTMATINGSKPCGFQSELGILGAGKKADMILVDLKPILQNPWTSPECKLSNLVIYRALGRNVDSSVIGGKIVMKNRKILTIDVDALYNEVNEQAERWPSKDNVRYRELLYAIKPYYQKWYNDWLKDLQLYPYYNMNSRI